MSRFSSPIIVGELTKALKRFDSAEACTQLGEPTDLTTIRGVFRRNDDSAGNI